MAFRLTIGVCLVQVTVDSMNPTEPGESVHVGRAFRSSQTWRLRRSALIRHWTTRLNVITTGGWRFIRLHAAGKPTAAFKRSKVEPLSASKFQGKTRDILIIATERAKIEIARKRGRREGEREGKDCSARFRWIFLYFRLFLYGTMNSSAGAGNYRRGSAKGDKVTAEAFSYTLFKNSHPLCICFPWRVKGKNPTRWSVVWKLLWWRVDACRSSKDDRARFGRCWDVASHFKLNSVSLSISWTLSSDFGDIEQHFLSYANGRHTLPVPFHAFWSSEAF